MRQTFEIRRRRERNGERGWEGDAIDAERERRGECKYRGERAREIE